MVEPDVHMVPDDTGDGDESEIARLKNVQASLIELGMTQEAEAAAVRLKTLLEKQERATTSVAKTKRTLD
eukprot:5475721-Alexandrium_andersonii.AAC.1